MLDASGPFMDDAVVRHRKRRDPIGQMAFGAVCVKDRRHICGITRYSGAEVTQSRPCISVREKVGSRSADKLAKACARYKRLIAILSNLDDRKYC